MSKKSIEKYIENSNLKEFTYPFKDNEYMNILFSLINQHYEDYTGKNKSADIEHLFNETKKKKESGEK